jgi:hypothetical protein
MDRELDYQIDKDPVAFTITHDSMPASYMGREITIPDKHEIIGFALQVDENNNITWIDLKTWIRPTKR